MARFQPAVSISHWSPVDSSSRMDSRQAPSASSKREAAYSVTPAKLWLCPWPHTSPFARRISSERCAKSSARPNHGSIVITGACSE
jgi:hypothetical protein